MPKCQKFYPNCQWTITHCWPNMTLDTVLLTKVYWSYSTRIVRVCFTPLLQSTFKRDLKHNRNVQIPFNSSAMASLYELLCYHSLENFDPIMDEFLTFIHSSRSSLSSATSTALPETADDHLNDS